MSATTARAASPQRQRDARTLRAFHEEDAVGKAYDARLVRRLWPFVRPHARFIAISLFALVTMTGLNLVRPLLMGDVVKQAGASDARALFRDGALLTLLVVVTQAISFGQIYSMQIAG